MHVCVGVCVCVHVSAASPAVAADVTSSQSASSPIGREVLQALAQ